MRPTRCPLGAWRASCRAPGGELQPAARGSGGFDPGRLDRASAIVVVRLVDQVPVLPYHMFGVQLARPVKRLQDSDKNVHRRVLVEPTRCPYYAWGRRRCEKLHTGTKNSGPTRNYFVSAAANRSHSTANSADRSSGISARAVQC